MTEINDVTSLTESVKRIAKAIDSESDTKSITDSLDAIADYIEENGIGGGGGSSDFRTAQVAVTNGTNGVIYAQCACYMEQGGMGGSIGFMQVDRGATVNINVAIYKDFAVVHCTDTYVTGSVTPVSVTGDATIQGTDIFVTGDCGINF